MIFKRHAKLIIFALSTLSVQISYGAEALDQLIEGGKVTGNLRVYNFDRIYDNEKVTDLHAFAFAGKIKAETGEINGFSGALGYYFANDLGINNHDQNDKYLNTSLMGNEHAINVLGEAYAQYKNSLFFTRVGNQVIDTPWINASDAMAVPNLYQAVSAALTPAEGLKIEADRIYRYKNRTASDFDRKTIFDAPGSNPKFTDETAGAIALGANYKNEQITAKAWLYKFYDFANLAYLQGGYSFPKVANLTPYVDLQYMKETGSGEELLGSVDSKAYGAKFGVLLPEKLGNVYLAYNRIPSEKEAGVSNGNLLSPYTQGYVTDPLYTSGLNYGLVSSRAPGHAYQLGMTIKPLGENLDISTIFSRYYTEPYVANVQTYTFDVAYRLSSSWKGFTIRDRLGINHGNPQWGSTYIDNRVMLSYSF